VHVVGSVSSVSMRDGHNTHCHPFVCALVKENYTGHRHREENADDDLVILLQQNIEVARKEVDQRKHGGQKTKYNRIIALLVDGIW